MWKPRCRQAEQQRKAMNDYVVVEINITKPGWIPAYVEHTTSWSSSTAAAT